MLCIHRPDFKGSQTYCFFEDGKNYRGELIELPDGYEFSSFQPFDNNSVIKGYIQKNKYIIISVWDTCWVGKDAWILREFIENKIPIFTSS